MSTFPTLQTINPAPGGDDVDDLVTKANTNFAAISAWGTGGNIGAGLPVFNVKSFGALGDNRASDPVGTPNRYINNEFNAFRAAYDAAVAAGGGIVYIPAGTFYIEGTSSAAIKAVFSWPSTQTKPVIIRGAGRDITTVRLSTNIRSFIAIDGIGNQDYSKIWQNLFVEDLHVDNNSLTTVSAAYYGVLLAAPLRGSILNFHMRRVNCGRINRVTSGLERRCIDIVGLGNNATPELPIRIQNMSFEDCVFGTDGNGGNMGWELQGYIDENNADLTYEMALGIVPRLNVIFDDLRFTRCRHFSAPTALSGFEGYGANIHVGGNGYGQRIIVDDFVGTNASDDGIEINGMTEVYLRNTWITGCPNAGLYFPNGGGISTNKDNQVIYMENHRGRTIDMNQATRKPGFGHIIVKDVKQTTLNVRSAFKTLLVDGFRRYSTLGETYTYPNANSRTSNDVQIGQTGDRARIVLRNIDMSRRRTLANPNNYGAGTNQTEIAIKFNHLADADVLIDGMSCDYDAIKTGGNSDYYIQIFGFNSEDQRTGWTDTFSGNTIGNVSDPKINYRWDLGAPGDDTVTGGNVTPTLNLDNERRLMWVMFNEDIYSGFFGSMTDQMIYAHHTPGSTLQGYKGAATAIFTENTVLEAYATDDGTNSYLCLDKVIEGVRTSCLAASTNGGAGTVTDIATPGTGQSDRGILLASRLVPGTTFTVVLKKVGEAISALFWAASLITPNPNSAVGGTATATATLGTGIETRRVGSNMQSYPGYAWVPKATDAKVALIGFVRMGVVSMRVKNLKLMSVGRNINEFRGIINSPGTLSQRIKQLDFEDCDFSALGAATIMSPGGWAGLWQTQQALKDKLRVRRMQLPTNLQPTVGTVTMSSSPQLYTNVDGYDEQIRWSGGTLTTPYVEVSTNGGSSFQQVQFASEGGSIVLPVGGQIRFTYSSAPTVRKIPQF